ncbi:MAG: sn-glycerol-1-phosphate dehydrogenase [Firmicutes bacterium]|nr:sn-glycerol-1-phosphate dehydrogenase [Bacillota bacterium]
MSIHPTLRLSDLAGLDLQCCCGRRHQVPIRHIVTGKRALDRLPEVVASFSGKHALLVGDSHTWPLAGEKAQALLTSAGIQVTPYIFSRRDHYLTDEYAIGELLVALPQQTDLIVTVGSGTMNDVTRAVAVRCGLPWIIIGTAPSMDGYASSTSAIIINDEKRSVPLGPPYGIVMDTDLLVTAPDEMLSAGIGDVLGKYVTLADWRLAAQEGKEHYCETIAGLIEAACGRCLAGYENVLARVPAAIEDMAGTLVMAGVAISMFGTSRPCAGSEHQLAHVWEVAAIQRGGQSPLHGNFVGLGTVASILLYQAAAENFGFADLLEALPEAEMISDILSKAGGWASKERLGIDRALFESSFTHAARTNPRYTILTYLEERGCLETYAKQVTALLYDV